jgi:hypothetical protein
MTKPSMSKRKRWGGIVLGALAASLILGSGAALAADASPEAASADLTASEREELAQTYTDCVRANGVPDFAGVAIAEDGTMQLALGEGINPFSDVYQAAVEACAELLPDGILPQEPSVETPAEVMLPFTCESNCPSAPAAPAPPG